MAETKGMTIEFSADISKLQSDLKKVDAASKKTANELRAIDNGLKFNPGNVTLLKQKFDILKKSVDEASDRLNILKQKEKALRAAGVDESSAEFRELQREIIKTENQLDRAKKRLHEFGNVPIQKISHALKGAGDKLTAAGQAMSGFSRACAAATVAIGALAVKSGLWADDLNTMSKVYHIGTDELQKYSIAADLVDVEVETIAKAHQKLTKTMSSATKKNSESAKAFKKLGVNVKDSNGNFRDTEDVFNDAIKALGGIENETERDAIAMKLFGKSASELNPLIEDGGETYKNLSETLSKYGLEPISQETLDKANQFNDQLDTMKAIGLTAFQMVGTQLASQFAPVLEKVVDLVGRLAGWFTSLSPQMQTIIAAVVAAGAVIAPLLIGLGKLAFAINAIITLAGVIGPVLGGAFAVITGPIGLAVAAVAGFVAAGIWAYKNWDKIKAIMTKTINAIRTAFSSVFSAIKARVTSTINSIKTTVTGVVNGIRNKVVSTFSSMRDRVASTFSSMKEKIVSPIRKAQSIVSGIVSRLRNLFPLHIGKIFSGLKLPHFNISAGKAPFGLGGKGTKPSISVDWYAKAMRKGIVLDNATIFGAMNGKLLGGGETGREVVVGANSLSGIVASAVARGMSMGAGSIASAVGTQTALASGATAQPIAVNVYLYKNGPQMGRYIVDTYDTWKSRLG